MGDDRDAMRFRTTSPSETSASTGTIARRLLVVYSPDDRDVGASRIVASRPIALGRAAEGESAFVLYDREASRHHATVEADADGRHWVADRASRNGTLLDGVRVDRAPLAPGSILRIGSHVLMYQAIAAEAVGGTLDGAIGDGASPRGPLVGRSPAIQQVRDDIAAAARLGSAVVVLGESGVGKELVAAEIHRASGRAGALVPVNCAALPEDLAESELFGHARGAFTGAGTASHGLFGAADGGTIFLDEIGDMPLSLQAKLLRALESGEVRAVGDTRARRVDVRVVAATNVDIEQRVAEGHFRGDLWARLMGTVIRVPPLRARREDVLLILVARLGRAEGDDLALRRTIARSFSPDAAEALLVHDWRFNVRELAQLVSRLEGTLGPRDRIELAHLPDAVRARIEARASSAPRASSEPDVTLTVRPGSAPTAAELRVVVEHFRGNVSRVAAFFGKERRQIYRWAERLGVDLDRHRAGEEG